MAKLDYAFLAQWAGVQGDGTLTSVGMSFTRLDVSHLGQPFTFAVAGRVKGYVHERQADLTVAVSSPAGEVLTVGAGLALPEEAAYAEDGRTHALFALNTTIQLTHEGLYRVTLEGGSETWRELDVGPSPPPRGGHVLTVAEAVDAARAWAETTSPLASVWASSAWACVSFDEGPGMEGVPMHYVDRQTGRVRPTTIPDRGLDRGMELCREV